MPTQSQSSTRSSTGTGSGSPTLTRTSSGTASQGTTPTITPSQTNSATSYPVQAIFDGTAGGTAPLDLGGTAALNSTSVYGIAFQLSDTDPYCGPGRYQLVSLTLAVALEDAADAADGGVALSVFLYAANASSSLPLGSIAIASGAAIIDVRTLDEVAATPDAAYITVPLPVYFSFTTFVLHGQPIPAFLLAFVPTVPLHWFAPQNGEPPAPGTGYALDAVINADYMGWAKMVSADSGSSSGAVALRAIKLTCGGSQSASLTVTASVTSTPSRSGSYQPSTLSASQTATASLSPTASASSSPSASGSIPSTSPTPSNSPSQRATIPLTLSQTVSLTGTASSTLTPSPTGTQRPTLTATMTPVNALAIPLYDNTMFGLAPLNASGAVLLDAATEYGVTFSFALGGGGSSRLCGSAAYTLRRLKLALALSVCGPGAAASQLTSFAVLVYVNDASGIPATSLDVESASATVGGCGNAPPVYVNLAIHAPTFVASGSFTVAFVPSIPLLWYSTQSNVTCPAGTGLLSRATGGSWVATPTWGLGSPCGAVGLWANQQCASSPSGTATETASLTPSLTPSQSSTPSETASLSPSQSQSASPTGSQNSTGTQTPSLSGTPSATATPSVSMSPSQRPSLGQSRAGVKVTLAVTVVGLRPGVACALSDADIAALTQAALAGSQAVNDTDLAVTDPLLDVSIDSIFSAANGSALYDETGSHLVTLGGGPTAVLLVNVTFAGFQARHTGKPSLTAAEAAASAVYFGDLLQLEAEASAFSTTANEALANSTEPGSCLVDATLALDADTVIAGAGVSRASITPSASPQPVTLTSVQASQQRRRRACVNSCWRARSHATPPSNNPHPHPLLRAGLAVERRANDAGGGSEPAPSRRGWGPGRGSASDPTVYPPFLE